MEIGRVYRKGGVLVDLTEWASAETGFMGGFRCPVAVTASVWAMIEAIPQTPSGRCQDVRGRSHDVLFLAMLAIRPRVRGDRQERARFEVILPTARSRKRVHVFEIVMGPGDEGEVVVTIQQPGEE